MGKVQRIRQAAANRREDRYGEALVLVIASILVSALAGNSDWGVFVSVVVVGGTLLFILRASLVGHRYFRLATVVVSISVLAALVAAVVGGAPSKWGPGLIAAMLGLLAPAAIVHRLSQHDRVTAQTVLGALCLYLLGGLFFAFVFGALGNLQPPFFVQEAHPQSLDYVYFSFVTQATVGYGDLTARTDVGRMLAVSEALIGQLYLVSVVALLVSNIGRSRIRKADWDEDAPRRDGAE
jgi:Ion channel